MCAVLKDGLRLELALHVRPRRRRPSAFDAHLELFAFEFQLCVLRAASCRNDAVNAPWPEPRPLAQRPADATVRHRNRRRKEENTILTRATTQPHFEQTRASPSTVVCAPPPTRRHASRPDPRPSVSGPSAGLCVTRGNGGAAQLHARRMVGIRTVCPPLSARVALWRAHCEAGIGIMTPISDCQNLLFSVARGRAARVGTDDRKCAKRCFPGASFSPAMEPYI